MKRTVLIVDDFEYNLLFEERVIKSLEKETGISIAVEGVTTVKDALQKIEENDPYDAMVIDMNLPDGTGVTIAQTAVKKSKKTKIAALTLYPSEYEEHHTLFDQFLRKPIMPLDYKQNFVALLGLSA